MVKLTNSIHVQGLPATVDNKTAAVIVCTVSLYINIPSTTARSLYTHKLHEYGKKQRGREFFSSVNVCGNMTHWFYHSAEASETFYLYLCRSRSCSKSSPTGENQA